MAIWKLAKLMEDDNCVESKEGLRIEPQWLTRGRRTGRLMKARCRNCSLTQSRLGVSCNPVIASGAVRTLHH